jgi:NAD(P)H-quinone oxidoreductase subunit 5
MGDMPMIDLPSFQVNIEVGFGILFLTGFFVMKLGIYSLGCMSNY